MIYMDDNELAAVEKLLKLAKLSVIAILVVGGYMNSSAILGLV